MRQLLTSKRHNVCLYPPIYNQIYRKLQFQQQFLNNFSCKNVKFFWPQLLKYEDLLLFVIFIQ